jgi:hypothetical protein
MSDSTDDTKTAATVGPAKLALELKRRNASAQTFGSKTGRLQSEKVAAARAASLSKPALRK